MFVNVYRSFLDNFFHTGNNQNVLMYVVKQVVGHSCNGILIRNKKGKAIGIYENTDKFQKCYTFMKELRYKRLVLYDSSNMIFWIKLSIQTNIRPIVFKN